MNDNADRYALAKVVAKIKEDACDNRATDVYALAKDLQRHLPSLPHSDLIKLIESAVAAIGGAALWEKRGEHE